MYDLYCHIWLNFPEDDHHYFYILLFTIAILVTLNIPQKILIYIFWKKVKIYLFSFLWYQKFEFFIKNLRKISQMYIRKKKKKTFQFLCQKMVKFHPKKKLGVKVLVFPGKHILKLCDNTLHWKDVFALKILWV